MYDVAGNFVSAKPIDIPPDNRMVVVYAKDATKARKAADNTRGE